MLRFFFLILFLFSALVLHAEGPNPAEAKLRESLRNTMLQLRTAQTEQAALQALQVETETKNKALAAQVAAMGKQLAADKDASDAALGELRGKLEAREKEVADLNESLAKWKTSQKQAADLAERTEAKRAKLADEAIVLQRRVADQQTKNAAMYKLGTEILGRYEKFGIGDALTAREPFVGITRVKFENLIQDYSDKIADQKITP